MKRKLILLTAFVCSSLFAQTEDEKLKISENQWLVGGSVSAFSATSKRESDFSSDVKDENKSLGLNPNVGYAIKDNLVLGMSIALNRSKNTTDEIERKTRGWGLALYIQQYIPLGRKITFDVKGEISYLKSKNEFDGSSVSSDNHNLFIGVRPGLTFKLNDKIALQTSIGSFGYSNSESTYSEGKVKRDSFGLNLDLSLREFNFGILVSL